MTELRLDWCSYEAAKYAVEHWHYSKNMPRGANNYIGAWEDEKFIGAIVFGYSISPQLGKQFQIEQTELTELRRVALKSHSSSVSRMVKISLKLLKEKNPNLRLVISFADSEQGHYGGIYQAGNWIFVGASQVGQKFILGKWRNDVHANRMNISEQRKAPPKYKYLYPLDDAMRKQIEPLRKPYPKRGQGETDSAPAPKQETGGARPTCPLKAIE
jgi:hypothetical protein